MTLTFYTNPMSRGRIARWMLEETGAPYDTVLLDWEGSIRSPDYLAINPMGKVPAIVHDGRVVTEAAAVCAYLAEAFPEAGLAPTDAERADYYRWMFFAAGPIEALMGDKALGVEIPADKRGMIGYGDADLVTATLEKAVSAHPFIAGDRFTAADVYVGSMVGWGTMFGSLPKRPAFEDYLARVNAREAAVRAREIDDRLMTEHAPAAA
jgi:glutathione S-transferase